MFVELESGNLKGSIETVYQYGLVSHIVRVRKNSNKVVVYYGDQSPRDYWVKTLPDLYIMCFGNRTQAENKLIELLEYPEWTVLKYS
jgi:hypothetical protein